MNIALNVLPATVVRQILTSGMQGHKHVLDFFLLLPRFSGQRKQNSQASPDDGAHSDLLFSYARNHTTAVMHTRVRCLVHFCDETHEMVRGWIEKHEAPLCLQTHLPLHSSTKSVRSLLNVCGRPYEHENRLWKCCLQRLVYTVSGCFRFPFTQFFSFPILLSLFSIIFFKLSLLSLEKMSSLYCMSAGAVCR